MNIEKVDGMRILEDNILLSVTGRAKQNFSGVKEPGMLYNDDTETWDTLWLFP